MDRLGRHDIVNQRLERVVASCKAEKEAQYHRYGQGCESVHDLAYDGTLHTDSLARSPSIHLPAPLSVLRKCL